MDKWQQIRNALNGLTCTVRHKAQHKHNSYIYKEVAEYCADLIGGNSYLMLIVYVEDYIKAANQDYTINTGKKLSEIAHWTKHKMQGICKDYYLDTLQ